MPTVKNKGKTGITELRLYIYYESILQTNKILEITRNNQPTFILFWNSTQCPAYLPDYNDFQYIRPKECARMASTQIPTLNFGCNRNNGNINKEIIEFTFEMCVA